MSALQSHLILLNDMTSIPAHPPMRWVMNYKKSGHGGVAPMPDRTQRPPKACGKTVDA